MTRLDMQASLKAYRAQGTTLLIKLNTTNEALQAEILRIEEIEASTVAEIESDSMLEGTAVATDVVGFPLLAVEQLYVLARYYGIKDYASLDRPALCEKIHEYHHDALLDSPSERLRSFKEYYSAFESKSTWKDAQSCLPDFTL